MLAADGRFTLVLTARSKLPRAARRTGCRRLGVSNQCDTEVVRGPATVDRFPELANGKRSRRARISSGIKSTFTPREIVAFLNPNGCAPGSALDAENRTFPGRGDSVARAARGIGFETPSRRSQFVAQRAEVVDRAVKKTSVNRPSAASIGCTIGRVEDGSRRIPSVASPTRYPIPLSSGPRCCIASHMRFTAALRDSTGTRGSR